MSSSSRSHYAAGHHATPPAGLRTAGLSSSPDEFGNKVSSSHFRPIGGTPSTPSRKGRTSSGPGPERSPHRSRSRPQSPTNSYREARANSNRRPRPSTPPPQPIIPASAYSPLSPPSKYNKYLAIIHRGARYLRLKVPSGQELLCIPTANFEAVPRRGSTPEIEFQKRFQLVKNHTSAAHECGSTMCAYWKSSFSVHDYEVAHQLQPPRPGDVVHYRQALPDRCAGKVEFCDKHLAVHPNDPTATEVLPGVGFVDVLLAESGQINLPLVDGDSTVSFINGNTPEHIDLEIRINGYPSRTERIAISCEHGQLTRRGLLHEIAKVFYRATKSGPPRTGHVHCSGLPEKISLDKLRLVSIYAPDPLMWHAQLLFCALEQKVGHK